jgi:hypothetical protein
MLLDLIGRYSNKVFKSFPTGKLSSTWSQVELKLIFCYHFVIK